LKAVAKGVGGLALFWVFTWILPILTAVIATFVVMIVLTMSVLTLAVINTTVTKEEAIESRARWALKPWTAPDNYTGALDTRWVRDPSMDDILTDIGKKEYETLRRNLLKGREPDPSAGTDLVYYGPVPTQVPKKYNLFTYTDYVIELDLLFAGKYPYHLCVHDEWITPEVAKSNARILKKKEKDAAEKDAAATRGKNHVYGNRAYRDPGKSDRHWP
jgi:hypothetical protein